MSELDGPTLDGPTLARLHAAALAASEHAHAPYSRFHVGAAVLLSDGSVVTAANMENASYGLSLCAEAVALATVNSAGRLADVVALLVTGGHAADTGPGEPVTPCGRCRQLVAEVAGVTGRDLVVAATDRSGTRAIVHPASGWLPHAFTLEVPA